MATRTFIGGSFNVASSYAENAVPVAGDDVIVSPSAGNGWLSARLPATGELRSFIVSNSYTGTINISDYVLAVGQGNLTGTIFDCGTQSNWQCGTGAIELYSTSTTTTGVNVVLANNINLQNVNFNFRANGVNRVIDFQTNFYCKDLAFNTSNITAAFRNITMFIYGNITETTATSTSDRCFHANNNEMRLVGSGNISLNNGLHTIAPFIISGTYGLSKNFNLYVANSQNNNAGIYITGTLNCNDYNVIITNNISTNACFVDIQSAIDRLVLKYDTYQSLPASLLFRIATALTVNKYFGVVFSQFARGRIGTVRSGTNGSKVAINLGAQCKYMLYYANFVDLSFNKPVAAFESSVSNCDNIKVVDFPIINVNTF